MRRPTALFSHGGTPVLWVFLTLSVKSGVPQAADALPFGRLRDQEIVAHDLLDGPFRSGNRFSGGDGWKNPWKLSQTAQPLPSPTNPNSGTSTTAGVLEIRGTGARNNPLRRELHSACSDRELFVRFDLNYRSDRVSDDSAVDPEFFVLWLDRLDGGDRATHASNVPNIGVHIADRGPKKGRNVFMVRIGPSKTAWSRIELQNNRTYRVVGRLRKSRDGARADYDHFDLWVDPDVSDFDSPDASVTGAQSVSLIRWVGFATGLKTEPTDRIQISQLTLGRNWQSALDPSAINDSVIPHHGNNSVVWNKPVDFRRDVYPLLKSRCFDCHSGTNPDSGYRLDVHRELLGYSSGEVLAEPGHARSSRLIEVLTAGSADERMPPDGADPLSDEQIAMLAAWIDQGMTWDEQLLPTPNVQSDHWSFQPVVRPDVPAPEDPLWVKTPVDAFIARMHAIKGVQHAETASPLTLVRRLYLDLTGLPPTPAEVNRFLMQCEHNKVEQAYRELVEQLLNSPHYGERWGRYWLDLARWAESQGYQHDIVRPYAWRYRDYVIRSFNADKPYDEFLKEQLAGDELQPYSDENLIATGFLGAARISGNQEQEDIQRNDVMVDIVNATGSVMLGLTLECAQCHNHKFDPITQRDYYRLQGFFVNGQLGNLSLRESDTPNPTDLKEWIPTAAFNFYSKEVRTLVKKKLFTPTETPHTWGFHSPATSDPGIERLPVVNRKPIAWQPDFLKQRQGQLYIRGEVSRPGPVVGSGWPEVLGPTPESPDVRSRSALAEWMADPQNGLVSRVWVNRLWQYHFGRGIVATPSDFGVEGARPSHPELLDWLASELMENGWSTRHIHRQIVLSNTYRQERRIIPANAAIDAENRLLWCWPRRRLEAEAIRDSVLVATGELDRTIGGVSVPPEHEEQQLRRTIYLFQQRSNMPSVMEMFDAPDAIASCSRRSVSTVALQPLFMLNSQFMTRRARALAKAVVSTAGDSVEERISVAFQRTLCRPPDAEERSMARRILGETREATSVPSSPDHVDHQLVQLCLALLNLNEFLYVP